MRAFDQGTVAGKTSGGIDGFDYVDGLPGLVPHPLPAAVPLGAPIVVSGWAVEPNGGRMPLAMHVLLDRSRPIDARAGLSRRDIMLAHKTDECVGYQVVMATGDLDPGAHELRAYALCSDGHWYESGKIDFRVYSYALPKASVVSRTLRMELLSPAGPVRANSCLLFRGWAFDAELRRGAAGIAAIDERGRVWSGPSNIERPDLRDELDALDDRLGFEIAIPAAAFERGRHRLEFHGVDAAGNRYPDATATSIDVTGYVLPFPSTARATAAQAAWAARLRSAAFPQPLPATNILTVPRDGQFFVEGWALDESGNAAAEVFIELSLCAIHATPLRLAADSADDASFSCALDPADLPKGDHDLALIVVQPGRRSYSRVPLATLRID